MDADARHGVIAVGVGADDLHDRRVAAVADALHRLHEIGYGSRPYPVDADPLGLVTSLEAAGHAVRSVQEIRYVPSCAAVESVMSGNTSWGPPIDKKQRKAVRLVDGVLITFPAVDGGDPYTVFTTDWSPLPAAAALAVHPDHPRALGDPKRLPRPTGEYVRHPLHGDLLPVWVAEWVRPDFGTGCVLVNPAHSEVDLEFARDVGLPVRFGLTTVPVSSDSATWPTAPIIKSGTVSRSGHFDGLSAHEAAAAYLETLSATGACRQVAWPALGSVSLASFDSGGAICPSPLALAAAGALGVDDLHLVVPSTEIDDMALWYRLLLADLAHTGTVTVTVVNRVAGDVERPELLLVGGRTEDVLSVKEQTVAQVDRFLDECADLAARLPSVHPQDIRDRAVAVARLGDFAECFAAAAKAAKAMRRGETPPAPAAVDFRVAVDALFEVSGSTSDRHEALAES